MRQTHSLRSLLALVVGSLLLAGPIAVAHMGEPGPPGSGMDEPLTMDEAVNVARDYMDRRQLPDVTVVEIMEFENHFYAATTETDSGRHAFALTIDRFDGHVNAAPGPNQQWNLKYGPMMMGAGDPIDDAAFEQPMAISPDQARDRAQRFLHQRWPDVTVDADDVRPGYGYHTVPFQRNGQIAGMVSVHGTTGEVWRHDWHGSFIGMRHMGGPHHRGHGANEPPHDPGDSPLARFEANGNGVIDDGEFMTMMDAWVRNDLTNDRFLQGMDLWISERPIRSSAVPATSANGALTVATATRGQTLTLRTQADNVASMQVDVYGLGGRPIFSGETSGSQLAWPMITDGGAPVANGVYLYHVTARTTDGHVQRSQPARISVLR